MRPGQYRSRARIYRPGAARNARGATVVEHALIGTTWLGISTLRRSLQNFGAGELPNGSMEVESHANSDIRGRDVLVVFAGPETGSTWRVEGVSHPGNRTILGVLTPYNETLEITT